MNQIIKMEDDEYFAYPALSSSFLIAFDYSPAHAFLQKEPTKSQELGSYFHTGILEPERLSEYIIAPPECLNRKNKPYPVFEKQYPDKEIVLQKEADVLSRIKENIFKCEIDEIPFIDIYDKSQKEFALLWSENGLDCKAKADIFYQGESANIIIDIKSTADCMKFHRSVINYQYYRQAWHYSNGATIITGKPTLFYFVALEKVEPFGVKVFRLTDDYLLAGQLATTKTVMKYVEWQNNGADKTIVYDNKTEILEKPYWIK
jgi:hypothetical protein